MRKTKSKVRIKRKPAIKRRSKKITKRRNPVSLTDVDVGSPVVYRNKIMRIAAIRNGGLVTLNDFGKEYTVSLKDIDLPKVRPQTEVEKAVEKGLAARTPVFVKFTDYEYKGSQGVSIQVMIFVKLNSVREPVSKWHYGIDFVKQGKRIMGSIESEKMEFFRGYDSEGEAKNAAFAILKAKTGVVIPRSIEPKHKDQIAKL